MPALDTIIRDVHEREASDLHMTTGSPPMIRCHKGLMPLSEEVLTAEGNEALLLEIMSEEQKAFFHTNKEIDFGYELEGVTRLRCNIFMQRQGIAGVFRLIPTKILTLDELSLPEKLREFCDLPMGLVVVTGATGSGKSTTLAAMIDHINTKQSKHILTIEDPIEFVHEMKSSLVNQREVGSSTLSFSNALRSALREDPDIILVGEMRDLETIRLALTAAETGHLVFGTLHTNSAAGTVDRIIDVFPAEEQDQIRVMLSDTLKGVVAQRLLPKKDGSGRVAAIEILASTTALANLIREGKTFQLESIIQTGKKEGMISMDAALAALMNADLISPEEGMKHARDKSAFQRVLMGV